MKIRINHKCIYQENWEFAIIIDVFCYFSCGLSSKQDQKLSCNYDYERWIINQTSDDK